jgi:hypothetical protein
MMWKQHHLFQPNQSQQITSYLLSVWNQLHQ